MVDNDLVTDFPLHVLEGSQAYIPRELHLFGWMLSGVGVNCPGRLRCRRRDVLQDKMRASGRREGLWQQKTRRDRLLFVGSGYSSSGDDGDGVNGHSAIILLCLPGLLPRRPELRLAAVFRRHRLRGSGHSGMICIQKENMSSPLLRADNQRAAGQSVSSRN